ncbi:MAG: heparinase II/III family protein, partial [Planctomycetota bacterium]
VKGGYNQVNHGHLDLGNFEMDALGLRWVRDLGRDNYNLEGYWDKKKGGQRWTYYRNSSVSHSVPLLNGRNQNVLAEAKFTTFNSEESAAFVVVDLTEAYSDFANKTMRGVAMINNRRAVLIQDEFEIEKACEITWAMTTDADIDVTSKTIATLTLKGRQMVAKILSPDGARFSVESAEQEPPQMRNEGVKRLIVKTPGAKGDVRIAVLLSPVWAEANFVKTAELKPLSQW